MGDKGSFNDIFTEDMPAKIKHIGKVEPVEEKHESVGVKKLREICTTVGINTVPSAEESLKKAGAAATKSAKDVIGLSTEIEDFLKKLAEEPEPVKVQRYDLFLMDPHGDRTEIYHQGTDEEIRKAMRAYRMKHYPILEANKTPYRVWMIKDNLMVDFGTGSYFMVPGMDHDTFVKGK
jgi:vancomycin resistance protein YoaR